MPSMRTMRRMALLIIYVSLAAIIIALFTLAIINFALGNIGYFFSIITIIMVICGIFLGVTFD